MYISEIYLRGYIAFQVPGIDELHYTMDKSMQIILGTNGSGKSKLLERLTPMPPDKNLFEDNGLEWKRITINNIEYKLTSDFSEGKQKHSFYDITNDMELNDGGTVTVQRQLAEQIFQYTDKIHEIVTGKVKFTKMSPKARQDVLLKSSNVDLTYALKLYDAAYTDFKNTRGAYKYITAKLESMKEEIKSDEELKAIERRIHIETENLNRLNTFISEQKLLMEQNPNTHNQEDFMKHAKIVEAMTKDYVKAHGYQSLDLESINGDERYAKGLQQDAEEKRDSIKERANEILTLMQDVDKMEMDDNSDVIVAKVERLKMERAQLQASVKDSYLVDPNNTPYILGRFVEMFNGLRDSLDEITYHINVDKFKQSQEVLKAWADEKNTLSNGISNLKNTIEELTLKNANGLVCDNCGKLNHYDKNASSENISMLKSRLHEKMEYADLVNNDAIKIELEERFKREANTARSINNILHETEAGVLIMPLLKNVHNITLPESELNVYIGCNISNVYNMVLTSIESCKAKTQIDLYDKEITKYESVLEFIDSGIMDKAEKLEEELAQAEEDLVRLSNEYSTIAMKQTRSVQLSSLMQQSNKLIQSYESTVKHMLSCEMHKVASIEASSIRHRISELNSSLLAAKTARELLEDTRKSVEELKDKLKATKDVSDALSPRTGIIGDALRALLEKFTEDVNEKVAMVWGYDMEMLPYNNPDKLDFKLPFSLNGKKPAPDLSEGSDGQNDVFNFAITLCLMEYLNLSDYPVFMDEIGRTFDSIHGENLILFTNDLISSGRAKQLFMISHKVMQYSCHINADYVVLCENNTILPESYNENVKIS